MLHNEGIDVLRLFPLSHDEFKLPKHGKEKIIKKRLVKLYQR